MRILSYPLPLAASLMLVSGLTTAATPSRVDPAKLPKVECSTLRYSQDFLAKYPKAPAACLEARIYKNQTYIKVSGKVYVTDKDTPTVAFMDAYGNSLSTVTIKDPGALRVILNHKEVDFSTLRVGQALSFWIPQSVFGMAPTN